MGRDFRPPLGEGRGERGGAEAWMASYKARLTDDLDEWIEAGLVPSGNRQAILIRRVQPAPGHRHRERGDLPFAPDPAGDACGQRLPLRGVEAPALALGADQRGCGPGAHAATRPEPRTGVRGDIEMEGCDRRPARPD